MADPIILKTERLLLRPPFIEDAAAIAAHLNQKDISWNLGRVPHPYTVAEAETWLQDVPEKWQNDTSYVMVMTLPGDDVIGCVSMRLLPMDVWELGYWLGKSWWGNGYTTEAAKAMLDWAERDLSISRFSSGHFIDNQASGRTLLKLGFTPVGETELFGLARGGKSPCIRYTKGTEPDLALKLVVH